MTDTVPSISLEKAKGALGRKDVVFLDVRTRGEYGRGKIPGSINLPLDEIAVSASRVIPDRSATIYAYCLTSHRSAQATAILRSLGYGSAFNMEYGMLGWRAKHYPVNP